MEKQSRYKSPEKALARLAELSSRREMSTEDARRLMGRWGVERERYDEILRYLTVNKYIDDRRFTENYVREKVRLSGWGVFRIKNYLITKRIPSHIINEVLEQYDREQFIRRLEMMLRKKMSTVRSRDLFDMKNKLLRYGISLGYQFEDVIAVVEKLMNEKQNE